MEHLVAFSRRYGADRRLTIAGGGNTSMKEDGVLHVKRSGAALARVSAEDFVALDLAALRAIPGMEYPDGEREREAAFLSRLNAARLPGQEDQPPSVETVLHALLGGRYVLHLHPAVVNGLTCSVKGEQAAAQLFPEAVWVSEHRPGCMLAMAVADRVDQSTRTVFLQNHGVFYSADTPGELDEMLWSMLAVLEREINAHYDPALHTAPDLSRPFTPDHMVYCGLGPELLPTENASLLWESAQTIARCAAAFGGSRPMSRELVDLILHWEVDRYRTGQI